MKKKTKKIFGLVGLALVICITAVACTLPGPKAKATQSLTDTIQVRVVGDTPDVRFNQLENRMKNVYPVIPFLIEYENISKYKIILTHNGDDDNPVDEKEVDINYKDFGEDAYAISYNDYNDPDRITLFGNKYDYGEYKLTVFGTAFDETKDFDERIFYYYPVIGNVTEAENGDYVLDLEYATEDEGGEVKKLGIKVYDEDGKTLIDTIWVDAPTKKVILPPAGKEDKYKSGNLRVEISAWNTNDIEGLTEENRLYLPYVTEFKYEVIPTPNAGSFLQELNISREDYLITGLIVFGTVAIAGIVFLKKSDTNKKRAHVNAKRRK